MNAPAVVFAYNRPKHLKKALTALSKNRGAGNTEVFVFIDGPKEGQDGLVQNEVLSVSESFKDCFMSLSIKKSERNKGLAKSVIGGVSEVIEKYGKVIVVEDDAVSAEGFLEFMNNALDFYENDSTIWSIGGFTVPMKLPDDYKYDVIKTQRSSSYAWATWKDRWNKIDWDVKDYNPFKRSFARRRRFNRWGNDRAGMLDCQMNGKVNSWAIRFDYAMFKNNMYNIVPSKSLIQTIGRDGSGTHSKGRINGNDAFGVRLENLNGKIVLERVEPDERIRKEFCKPFYLPLSFRAKEYIKNVL